MMHIVLYLLAFLVAFLLLVTVHEFGHFWVARRLGFKVLRFSIGMGKPLWRRAGADGVEYWIASIPIGGYVKMVDEREGPVAPADLPRAFTRRPHWQRLLVLLAGPGFNILFAVLVLTGLLFAGGLTLVRPVLGTIDPHSIAGQAGLSAGDEVLSVNSHPVNTQPDVELALLDAISAGRPAILMGVRTTQGVTRTAQLRIPSASERLRLTEPTLMGSGLGVTFYEPPLPALISRVTPGQPAARAGLLAGDRILAIAGQSVTTLPELQKLVQRYAGQSIDIRYRRGSSIGTVQLTPRLQLIQGKRVGAIGIEVSQGSATYPPSMLRHVDLSLPAAFVRANEQAWDVTALQGRMIWRMLSNKVSFKNLSGPLSIAEYAGDAASEGVTSFLRFLVLLSLAPGFMNLLPIPILDGGQIVFQSIEWLKGSPLSERVQLVSQQLGLALLFLLMGVALFNDLSQFG